MVGNSNFEKLRAKEKVKVLTLLLVFCGALSGVWEYYKTQTSLDEILVVYVSRENENSNENVVEKVNVVEREDNKQIIEENVVADEKINDEAKEEISVENVVSNDNKEESVQSKIEESDSKKDDVLNEVKTEEIVEEKSDVNAVNELLDYMSDVRERLNGVEMPEITLNRVIERIEDKKVIKDVNPFKEGELEIYDSNKGVVAIEKVEVIKENNESQENKKTDNQDIENKEENLIINTDNNEDGAIDMMKNIVERNAKEKKE